MICEIEIKNSVATRITNQQILTLLRCIMGKVSHAQASYVLRSPKMAAGPASLVTSKWIRTAFAIATKLHLGNTSLNGSSFTRFSTKSALPVLTLYTKVRFFG